MALYLASVLRITVALITNLGFKSDLKFGRKVRTPSAFCFGGERNDVLLRTGRAPIDATAELTHSSSNVIRSSQTEQRRRIQ